MKESSFKYILGLILFFLSSNSFSSCSLYLERFNLATNDHFEMDISDYYELEKPVKINNKKLKKNIMLFSKKLRISSEDKREVLAKNKNNELEYFKIKDIIPKSLDSFFIKGDLSKNRYFSFLLHTDCQLMNKP